MAAAKPSSGGGLKGALTRKLGPLPAWAWLLLVFVGIYAWRHYQSASGATAATGTTTADTSGPAITPAGDSSGGGSGGSGLTPDTSGLTIPDWLASPPSWLTTPPAALAADVTPPESPAPAAAPTTSTTPSNASGAAPSGSPSKPYTGAPNAVPVTVAKAPTASGQGVGTTGNIAKGQASAGFINVPVGSTNVRQGAGGAVIYTTPTGAIIEQAPGKSRYTVKAAPK